MPEPQELRTARRRLADAESRYGTPAGLTDLREGLGLLDDVMGAGTPGHAATAANLAGAYAARFFARIAAALAGDAALPEPELEQLFQTALAFDRVTVPLPERAADLKVEVARRLIDRYYEGHPPEATRRALEELVRLRDAAT
jgi:hypothetical protein